MSLSRVLRIVALLLIASIVTGCGSSSNDSSSANVRFMNALVDGGAINVVVGSDNSNVVTGLPFEGITGYLQVDSGSQEFKISVSGGTSTVIDQFLNLSGDEYYTYVVYGTASAPLSTVLTDDRGMPYTPQEE